MPSTLIQALQNPALYDHPAESFQVIETHISWVVLTGDYAYKIKKPVDFGFLDFSRLEDRRRYCELELSLNRRLAPQLYLAVVPICGTAENPQIGGTGEPFEYMVKMVRFPQENQLDRVLARGELTEDHIDQLAATLADFHDRIERAGSDSPFGSPDTVAGPVRENFHQIRPHLPHEEDLSQLAALEQWSEAALTRLQAPLTKRKTDGFIRNCHGDMHLANMALIEGEVVVFDCIEFNDNFRWIDVISEIAFTVMDLEDRGRADFAARLLNGYLQLSGDYEGLELLRFYQVYRALVRAKVACLRLGQSGLTETERAEIQAHYQRYIRLAQDYTQPKPTSLFIAHGVSGSGKTTLTQPLLERYGMIRIRSDVERKRLYGLNADADSGGAIYSADASRRTYDRLMALAQTVIESGLSVIVDATFLKRAERDHFRQLADKLDVPFIILHFYADTALLKQWVLERQQIGTDASEATVEVLEKQLETEEPISDDEADALISIDTGHDTAVKALIDAVAVRLKM